MIGHFHYVVAPGTIFALFAGIYYWFPKATGRRMNDVLGRIHFWGSFVCINIVFMPMFIQGLAGMNRRLYDGGTQHAHNQGLPRTERLDRDGRVDARLVPDSVHLQLLLEHLERQAGVGQPVGRNHPRVVGAVAAGHGNFLTEPVVYRGPYGDSVPGAAKDFTPQFEPERA